MVSQFHEWPIQVDITCLSMFLEIIFWITVFISLIITGPPYNSQGTTCNDDGLCTCNTGYFGDRCNKCENGYYVSNIDNGENTCTGKYKINSAGIFIKKCHFFPFLACICNKQGSICSDDGSCVAKLDILEIAVTIVQNGITSQILQKEKIHARVVCI